MDPNPELTHLYSCSRWAGKDPNEVISEFVRIGDGCCSELRLLEHVEDLPYDMNGNQASKGVEHLAGIDIWGEVNENMVVFIHGGFWQEGTRKVVSPAAVPLVKRGIALAAIGYEYASSTRTLLEVVRQVTAAVKLLLDRYPQVKAMTLAGHSAGAQLAFKVFTRLRSPRIQKLAFFAGAFDLKELPRCEIGTLIGLSPEEAEVNSCSALELAGADVRVLIMVALKDSPRLIDQNREMVKALKEHGIPTEYQEFQDRDHFSLIYDLRLEEDEEAMRFLSFLRM